MFNSVYLQSALEKLKRILFASMFMAYRQSTQMIIFANYLS